MIRKAFLVLYVFTLLWCGQSYAFVGTLSKLDDLYRAAIRSSEFKGMSEYAFKTSLKTGKISKLTPLLKNFPKEDRIRMLLEIAEERKLITGTQQLRLATKYSKMNDGDDLLMRVIDHGDKRLFDLAPKYGNKLLAIESRHEGAGVRMITNLGDDGWKVMNQIPENQILRLSDQSKSIASLESGTRTKILKAIATYPVKALEYLDTNSSIVYKTAGITGFFVFIDNISQPKTTKVTKPDGTVVETQSGALSEATDSSGYIPWFIGIILLAALVFWIGIQLWGSLKKKQAVLEVIRNTPEKLIGS